MTRVLIIDDEPGDRAYLKELAPPDWEWIEAGDVQSGVAAFLQAWRTLDLVVVDICLPDQDGHAICLSIRQVSKDMPILPFTATYHALPEIDEFGCLPPLEKPVDPEEGRRRLANLTRQPVRQSRMSPLAHWLSRTSRERLLSVETQLKRGRQRVIVFATNELMRDSLVRTLTVQERVSEARDDLSLRGALVRPGVVALVADGADYHMVRELAQDYAVPLVLVANTSAQLRALRPPEGTPVLLGSDPSVKQRLRGLVRAIADNQPIEPFLNAEESAAMAGEVVSPEIRARFADTGLTRREVEVVYLRSQGQTRKEIADKFGSSENTVKSHEQHAQEKLGVDKPGLVAWVRERVGQLQ